MNTRIKKAERGLMTVIWLFAVTGVVLFSLIYWSIPRLDTGEGANHTNDLGFFAGICLSFIVFVFMVRILLSNLILEFDRSSRDERNKSLEENKALNARLRLYKLIASQEDADTVLSGLAVKLHEANTEMANYLNREMQSSDDQDVRDQLERNVMEAGDELWQLHKDLTSFGFKTYSYYRAYIGYVPSEEQPEAAG